MPTGAEIVCKLARGYEKGMYTRLEVLCQFIEAAATFPPVELAEAMSGDWLAEVKTQTVDPLHSLKDGVYISGALLRDGIDQEAHYAEKRRLWAQGASNWHRFFA